MNLISIKNILLFTFLFTLLSCKKEPEPPANTTTRLTVYDNDSKQPISGVRAVFYNSYASYMGPAEFVGDGYTDISGNVYCLNKYLYVELTKSGYVKKTEGNGNTDIHMQAYATLKIHIKDSISPSQSNIITVIYALNDILSVYSFQLTGIIDTIISKKVDPRQGYIQWYTGNTYSNPQQINYTAIGNQTVNLKIVY